MTRDTTAIAEAMQLDIQRRMGASARLRIAFEMCDLAMALAAACVVRERLRSEAKQEGE